MSNFEGYRFPLVRRRDLESAGATNEEITFGPVPLGRMWVVNWLAFEDETTNFTSMRAYLAGLGYNHYLFADTSLVAAELYWSDNPIYIPEGRSLVVRFTGTTDGDALAAYLTGFEVIQPAPGAPNKYEPDNALAS
jgi:hypothetical protein